MTYKGYHLGKHIRLGRKLGGGGEGSIHEIIWLSSECQNKFGGKLVAKKYSKPSDETAAKLERMIANPPDDPTWDAQRHISIAWPQALIFDEQGGFVGFIMPYINPKKTFPLLRVYNLQDRWSIRVYDGQTKQQVPLGNLTWQYLLRIAYNLAAIVEELHSKGYVVGDLNESNILVTATSLVTLVDCDSMQVPKRGHSKKHPAYFHCPVGKREYTPPELQGQDFSQIDRAPEHDNFCLAVLIFLILMEGRHPFAMAWHGNGPPPTLAQSIASSVRESTFPYAQSSQFSPPKNALPLNILTPDIQRYLLRCFDPCGSGSNHQRPTAEQWTQVLEDAEKDLETCQSNPLHMYSKHLGKQCPWCDRVKNGMPDSFPFVSPPPPPPVPPPPPPQPPRQSLLRAFRALIQSMSVIGRVVAVLVIVVLVVLVVVVRRGGAPSNATNTVTPSQVATQTVLTGTLGSPVTDYRGTITLTEDNNSQYFIHVVLHDGTDSDQGVYFHLDNTITTKRYDTLHITLYDDGGKITFTYYYSR